MLPESRSWGQMVGGKAMVVAVQPVLECWRKGMGSWNLKRDVATARDTTRNRAIWKWSMGITVPMI